MVRIWWAPYAAAAWSFIFAVPSFYWAVGGGALDETIAADVDEALGRAGEWWSLVLIGVAKVIGGVLALALAGARPGRAARVLRMAAWMAGILLAVYGLASMVNHALMVAGAVDTPESLGRAAARWHLAFWDPWWILGGVLFVLAAWNASRCRGARAYSEDAGSTPAHGS